VCFELDTEKQNSSRQAEYSRVFLPYQHKPARSIVHTHCPPPLWAGANDALPKP